MGNVPNRRPPLATSVSTPDIFCRPMDPAPAPLVYINGWNGVGKETVAEYLTLLLGSENALLVDVRSVGREAASSSSCCNGSRTSSKHKHHRRHEHRPLLTPEHPRYFSPDLDPDAPDFSPLPSPSFSTSSCSPPISRSTSVSSASTAATSTTSSSYTSATPTTLKPTTSPTPTPTLVPIFPPNPTIHSPAPATSDPPLYPAQAQTQPQTQPPTSLTAPSPPCSSENLTALLTRPPNAARIAVLPACCPDTAAGRAALRTFEVAAARAGRLFVGVVLRCADGGGAACEGGRGGGGVGGGGGAGAGISGAGLGMGAGRGRGGGPRGRVASVGGLDSILLSSMSLSSSSSDRSGDEGAGVAAASEDSCCDGGVGGGGTRSTSTSFMGGGTGGYGEARGRSFRLPGAGTEAGGGADTWMETGACWARGGGPDLGLARPTKAGLTVDASCRPPFDVALQIIGFVKGLQAERDAELCSNAFSAATTPGEALGSEGKLEAPEVAEGK